MSLVIDSGFNYDADASAYIDAVEAADGQALETATRYAINNFVIGCKQDGIWSAIKASCILAGARTLAGCLVPLVGTAPTNFNFVSGDYNRKTGLVGDGSTKYLDSNVAPNTVHAANSNAHISTYVSTNGGTSQAYIGSTNAGRIHYASATPRFTVALNDATAGANIDLASGSYFPGFLGIARPGGTALDFKYRGGSTLTTRGLGTLSSSNYYILRVNDATPAYSAAQMAFYSLGDNCNLSTLSLRVTDLMNALEAAIP